MKFSAVQLYVNDRPADNFVFTRLKEVGKAHYRKGNYFYTIEQHFVSNRFHWIYFQYDNESLYSDKVFDKEDNSTKDNPRKKDQVEMRFQLFACYDADNYILYVSDYQKKATITDYISDMLQVSATTKNILRSIDDFLNVVTKLKSVSFTQRRTLFTSTDDSTFRKQANIYGLDLPERSKVKLDYGSSPIGTFKNVMRSWKNKRDSGEFEDIVVVGLDDSGFESIFNFSAMVSSVDVSVIKNDDCRYDPAAVMMHLINLLGGANENN